MTEYIIEFSNLLKENIKSEPYIDVYTCSVSAISDFIAVSVASMEFALKHPENYKDYIISGVAVRGSHQKVH